MWAAVDQLRADGTSVLLVTHELDEAERLCDRVVAMRAGRVLDAGSPAELAARHGTAATITFTQPPEPIPAARLAALPGVRLRAVSRLNETEPVGVVDQPAFRNAVVAQDVPAGPDPATGATALLIAL